MREKCPYLLDNARYMTIGQFEAGGLPVVLQISKASPAHCCIQYAGGGNYFDTLAEAMLYMHDRWGFDIIGKPRAVWVDDGKTRPLWEK